MPHDLYEELHLRPVVNASGTMTTYGQSVGLPEVGQAMAAALPLFFEMDQLHAVASATIARTIGAEAGFVTSCSAAGITIAAAACMAGRDPARIEQLPDTEGMADEVLIQMGHCCDFGAPVTQMIRLSGARVKMVGTVNGCSASLFAASLGGQSVAAVYVLSHHTTQYGCIPLPAFVQIAHARGIPVIVDAAAEEHRLGECMAAGADLVVCSGHKHFRGPTSGIVAGRLPLIQACYAQNRGIGRTMKIGKEGIIGLITALNVWQKTDHDQRREGERQRVRACVAALAGLPGIHALERWPEPDPYPIARVQIIVDPDQCGLSALGLATMLAEENPSVRVRDHHVDEGYLLLDPFTVDDREMAYISERIRATLGRPAAEKAAVMQRLAGLGGSEQWNDKADWPFHAPGGGE